MASISLDVRVCCAGDRGNARSLIEPEAQVCPALRMSARIKHDLPRRVLRCWQFDWLCHGSQEFCLFTAQRLVGARARLVCWYVSELDVGLAIGLLGWWAPPKPAIRAKPLDYTCVTLDRRVVL